MRLVECTDYRLKSTLGQRFGVAGESAFLEQRKKMDRATIGQRAQRLARGQLAQGFEHAHDGLGRLEAASIDLIDPMGAAAAGLLGLGGIGQRLHPVLADLARESDLPIASGQLTGFVPEPLMGESFIQRHGLEGRQEAQALVRFETRDDLEYFAARMTSVGDLHTRIQGDISMISVCHNAAKTSGRAPSAP
jgi:hypothetical protein